MFCREQVVQLHRARHELEAAGARLHVIGNGAPTFIAGFRETTGYDGPLYTDPGLAVYRAAAMRRGLGAVLSARVVASALRARRAGHRQGATQGDAMQNGGVLIVSPTGEVVYQFRSRAAGDHPSTDEVLAALST